MSMLTATTLALEGADCRDRWYFEDVPPSAKVAKQQFHEDGLLIRFGHPREEFDVPHPCVVSAFPQPLWPY